MIPKNAYMLTCIDSSGTTTNEYPQKHIRSTNENGYVVHTAEYIFDWKDLMDHVAENVSKKYKKVVASKVVDVMHVSIESAYEEKK